MLVSSMLVTCKGLCNIAEQDSGGAISTSDMLQYVGQLTWAQALSPAGLKKIAQGSSNSRISAQTGIKSTQACAGLKVQPAESASKTLRLQHHITPTEDLTLGKLEHILQAINDLQAPMGGQLANITSVEEAVLICKCRLLSVSFVLGFT